MTALFLALTLGPASAQNSEQADFWYWVTGDYYLTVGVAPFSAPRYEGSKEMAFSALPMIAIGRYDGVERFSSMNDNISFATFDNGSIRLGPVLKIDQQRDASVSPDLYGLKTVPWGVEVGFFGDFYPTDWFRLRLELRQGVNSFNGVVADLWGDFFTNLTLNLRLSGGPRLSLATAGYYDAYYGVDAAASLASGLAPYAPGGGLHSAGFGGALTWAVSDHVTLNFFAEYSRLLGPAAESSLVRQRGTPDQLLFGLSATYTFDFSLGKRPPPY